MKLLAMSLATLAVGSTVVATTAVAASRPATNPADPTQPIKINPNKTYPLQPDPSALSEGSPGGGLTTLSATRMYVSLRDSAGGSNGWARVRVKPGDLVEGNAKTNTTFDRQVTDGGSWWGGYFFGDIGGCGWILDTNASPKAGTPTTACASPSRNRTDIGVVWNGRSNCQPDGSCDGSATSATCDPIPEYANVRPWGTVTSPGTLIRTISNPGRNWAVMWRYATRDATWIMVRDPHIDNNDGNWVFIPKTCISYYPGAEYMTNG